MSAANHAGIQIELNPVQEAAQITVSGTATGAEPPPNGVTLFFVPPSGSKVELVINLPAPGGKFSWTGPVPGYATIPNGSTILAVTNRQVSAGESVGSFGPN